MILVYDTANLNAVDIDAAVRTLIKK